ncbi:scarecrow-like protein 18 [Cynara cardunculus var. scolymus]|uniref:Transcription factor GRAS n=1 Tax=Cynara cardunculus var. scolymus TaxID=59895 RepID=A0A103YJP0_CYNCS|nr:scarecrow-like protein 18 [Cynara cardunculus var. scolymus]KVI10285.1 Transcription factor GRAS [Cynara cardunculus var. scolymus]
MVGSSSHSHHQEEYNSQLDPPPRTAEHHHHHHTHMHQLLLYCAQLISSSDFSAAHRLISFLSAISSPAGDSSDRLVHSFTKALSLRLHHLRRHHPPQTTINTITTPTPTTRCCKDDDTILQKSYLSLNQITPFIRFSQLTANQAILDAIDQSHHHQFIHIIDFDTMHGVQWPPLMQAIAERHPPPSLRLTATGTNPDILRKTGDRLSKFANSLGLKFRFHPILLPNEDNTHDLIDHLSTVVLHPNETLAVNCVLYLHRLLKNRDNLCSLLKKIKTMNPRVVTMAEIESNHNYPSFMSRFGEALKYYAAVFDSLEATLPPNSQERMEVEEVWFGREIADVVAAEGERHERFRSWEMMMIRNGGFEKVSWSSFAISQAKMLLRLHYPSEGYKLVVVDDCFCLGWRNQPLFSVSSWH